MFARHNSKIRTIVIYVIPALYAILGERPIASNGTEMSALVSYKL
jgi:hypothetical protein